MIVRIFKAGRSRGESPVNYLLSDSDHSGEARDVKPEVLEGHPATTVHIINSIQRQHKYVSGVIAFRREEQPTRKQMHEVIDAFKATVAPGLSADQFNSLWVLHQDKGNVEMHFVFPMTTLSGQRMNIHPPGPKNIALYQTFSQVMNEALGYRQVQPEPMKLANTHSKFKNAMTTERNRHIELLGDEIAQAIQSGVPNRDGVCRFLEDDLGIMITRKGADYISVKLPGAKKAIRLKGPLFQEGTDYQTLPLAQSGKSGPVRLTAPDFQQAKDRLHKLVQERHDFNQKAYQIKGITPAKMLPGSNIAKPIPMPSANESIKTKTTTGGTTMKTNFSIQLIKQALDLIASIGEEKRQGRDYANKGKVAQNIASIRDKASARPAPAGDPTLDAFNDIQIAISQLDSCIAGEAVESVMAKTPEERARAEMRIARLQAQREKLMQQLATIKVRLLNESDKKLKM